MADAGGDRRRGVPDPGGVTSTDELWQLLLDRRDLVAGSDPGRRWWEDERVVPADLAYPAALRSGAFLDGIKAAPLVR